MDQSLPLATPLNPVSPSAAITTPERDDAVIADDEPDSPGRSPRAPATTTISITADPVAESLGQLGGMVIGLLSVVVPLAVVLDASSSGDGSAALIRSGAAAESPVHRAPGRSRPGR